MNPTNLDLAIEVIQQDPGLQVVSAMVAVGLCWLFFRAVIRVSK